MPQLKAFFENIDFSFDKDFYQKNVIFSENAELTEKLNNNIFVYDNKNIEQTQSSFYIITTKLTEKELLDTRRYIWNEDKYGLFFYPEISNTVSLFYAKTSPDKKVLKIDTFKGQDEDNEKLEKIKKWKFQSGAFWLSYADFIDKIKKSERIDEKLIKQLKILKSELLKVLGKDKIETIQSLIDRTLFIKFLEDNHIINSFFYLHFFNDKNLNYKKLLYKKDTENINLLFEKINEIFSNVLFATPTIKDKFIIKSSDLIYQTISQDIETGQLRLFDFRFDIIPIEFISHIYEVFLEDDQLDQGIYYTPPKLAQLIIDDTISETGKILDPACGSGMFLILGFRKLLNNNPTPQNANVSQKIIHKIDLLQKYVFGIEKKNTAWRLTIFSLYLEILKDLPSDEIKEYIKKRIEQNTDIKIFPDFTDNIREGNSLEVSEAELHFPNQTFDYIVGNPPFFKIAVDDDEISFINEYSIYLNQKKLTAQNIVGHNQISQAFMLKIKDWAKKNTKFGFVLNSSNFYNDLSTNFQEFFFENYQIESFYELSRVKKILFKKAKGSVIVAIFNNSTIEENTLKYYPVDLELFSETFKLLVIQEDKRIDLRQKDILEKNIVLRDYLIGNEYDLKLLRKLSRQPILNKYLLKDKYYNSLRGLERATNETIAIFFEIDINEFNKLPRKKKLELHNQFASDNYVSENNSETHNIPFVYNPERISSFDIQVEGYVNKENLSKKNFRRTPNNYIYKSEKILFGRHGSRIKAAFASFDFVFSTRIYGIKLTETYYYNLFTALFNSDIVNYYLLHKYGKRIDSNFSKFDTNAIKNIPIPKELDENLVSEISEISEQLTEGKLKYEDETKDKLNELIYDLYDLGYLERQRIKDFFSEKKIVEKADIEKYKETLFYTLEIYFENKPRIEYSIDNLFGFNLIVVGIYFTDKQMPSTEKVLRYEITQILRQSGNNLLAMQEIIFGKDCMYIIKDKQFKNWSETKAYEDGKFILKKI